MTLPRRLAPRPPAMLALARRFARTRSAGCAAGFAEGRFQIMQWAISTLSFPDALARKLEAAAKAGFTRIELFHDDLVASGLTAGDVRALCAELSLDLLSLQSLRDVEAEPDARRAFAMTRAARMVDLAAELGATMLVVCANTRPDALDDPARAAADLAAVADLAAARDLVVVYEALSTSAHVKTYRQAADIVARAGRPNLKLALSVAHTLFAGADFSGLAQLDMNRLGLVHLADAPDLKMDPHLLSGNYRLFPGQGDAPLRALTRELARLGYAGPVSLEIFNDQMRGMSPGEIGADGARAVALLERDDDAGVEEIAYIEIASFGEERAELEATLSAFGFARTHRHRAKNVSLWRNGAAVIVVNEDAGSLAESFYLLHGLSVCGVGYFVRDLDAWRARLTAFRPAAIDRAIAPDDVDFPAIRGPGGGQVAFLDGVRQRDVFHVEFEPLPGAAARADFVAVDHFSQAAPPAEFYSAQLFYRSLLGFTKGRQVGVIDPHGAVQSRVMRNADGRVRLSVTSSSAANSTTQRFLGSAMGAGYQHFAFRCDDLFAFADRVPKARRLAIPSSYYDALALRYDLAPDLVERLRARDMLYDEDAAGRFLQLYSRSLNGLFFEVVQRIGDYQGFGAANAPIRMAAQTREDEAMQDLLAEMEAD